MTPLAVLISGPLTANAAAPISPWLGHSGVREHRGARDDAHPVGGEDRQVGSVAELLDDHRGRRHDMLESRRTDPGDADWDGG
jgi:hypothetical protein